MTIPPSGTYRLRNVKYPNQMLDLKGGSGTTVVGYATRDNTQHILWTLQVINPETGRSRLISVETGGFLQDASSAGSDVTSTTAVKDLNIIERTNIGEYMIQTADGDFAFNLANGNNNTNVKYQKVDTKETGQGWIFCPA